jgi:alcohol dehydrogenase (cytochrome c)
MKSWARIASVRAVRFGLVFSAATVFCYLITGGGGTAFQTAAQTESAPAPKLFTAAQAARGKALYAQHCANCHGKSLQGTPSTPLAGDAFMEKWGDGKHTVDDLYFITKTQMPFGMGDTLTTQQYIDLVAFMLSANGYQAGTKPLAANSAALKKITIGSQKAGDSKAPAEEKPKPPSGGATSSASGARTANGGSPSQAQLNAAHGSTTDWLMPNHDYGGQRYVDLSQINRQNVASLKPVATYKTTYRLPFHCNPVVSGGLMYITTKDSTIALDATTLEVRWQNDRPKKGKEGWPMNRGVAVKDGKVIRGTHDGYLLALDAATGKVIWEREIVDMTRYEGGFTMAPVVFENLILIGPAGSELGIKGWVGAFRLDSGAQVWRFNTIPDAGEPGAETWEKADSRLQGGGAVWSPLSLDHEQGILYVPVANPAPDFYSEARPGKNLYSCSMVVLDVKTGKLKWYYQLVPHDIHDWDTTQVSPLFTATVRGKKRKLVATSGKDGLLHVLDRETREHLYEVPITTRLNVDVPLTKEGVRACPGVLGGAQWNGPSFNPRTNMLYVPAVDWCGVFKKADDARFVPGQFYMGGTVVDDPPDKSRGWLTAIDASTGAVKWKHESPRPMLAAVATTSADLVFTGELLGDFIVLDGKTGEVLYRHNTGARLNGGIATYSINGRQYVAVASGAANAFWRVPNAPAAVTLYALPVEAAGAAPRGRK